MNWKAFVSGYGEIEVLSRHLLGNIEENGKDVNQKSCYPILSAS
jgi:hypothetical protein